MRNNLPQRGFCSLYIIIVAIVGIVILLVVVFGTGEKPPEPPPGADISCAGVDCPACQYCVAGNCVARPDGYDDCASECLRCVNGFCQDYNSACSNCQHCDLGICIDNCKETDVNCGCASCINCNEEDGCVGNDYWDYACNNNSCEPVSESHNDGRCVRCGPCQYYSEGTCYNYCEGTDTNCGCTLCINCNDEDSCYGDIFRDYYCLGASCTYTSDSCLDCSCGCGGYNVKENIINENCNDGKDNDCNGLTDSEESACQVKEINLITRVIDGDTFDVLLTDGTEERIRLLGVDTPEKSGNKANEYDLITDTVCLDTWGTKTTDYAKSMLENKEVSLSFDSTAEKRDDYDRLLAYVEIDGQDFGTLLLQNGYTRVYTESDFEKEDYYVSLQQDAEANEIGLWSCKEEPSPYDNPCIVYCEDKCLEKHSFFSPGYILCFTGCLELCNIRNEIPF